MILLTASIPLPPPTNSFFFFVVPFPLSHRDSTTWDHSSCHRIPMLKVQTERLRAEALELQNSSENACRSGFGIGPEWGRSSNEAVACTARPSEQKYHKRLIPISTISFSLSLFWELSKNLTENTSKLFCLLYEALRITTSTSSPPSSIARLITSPLPTN